MNRYHLNSRDCKFFIETPYTLEGYEYLEKIRKTNPNYKRKIIKSVLQLMPDKIPMYKEIDIYDAVNSL
jgi:hypothetical protein